MQCPNCLAATSGAEARCEHCGRRLFSSSPRSAPEGYIPRASHAATALQAIPGGLSLVRDPEEEAASETNLKNDDRAYQPSLFLDVLTGAKVIPIPTLTPLR